MSVCVGLCVPTFCVMGLGKKPSGGGNVCTTSGRVGQEVRVQAGE